MKFAVPFDQVCQPAGGQHGGEEKSEIPAKSEDEGKAQEGAGPQTDGAAQGGEAEQKGRRET
jgi:hypothetical protein